MDRFSPALSLNGTKDARSDPAARTDPVFVLCMGRSGSTVLRFLLDAHPDLACPPETNLPALCAQLAVVWSMIEGAPLPQTRGDAPPVVPDAAVGEIRHMMDTMTGSYLARRGKKRFCDKSLGSARFADLLARVYPDAKFLCLYRHPMDVIRSGLEACPWGLNGYGFDQYIADSPGNAVMALARYWLDNALPITVFEEQYADLCHRIRYEDLVEAPEKTAQEIFAFVGVGEAPGIAQSCFASQRERFGPADHKIWATSKITGDSVGKGESVPAGLIPAPIASAINELADKLGYVRIEEDWGTPGMAADLRVPATIASSARAVGLTASSQRAMARSRLLAEHLGWGLDRIDGQFIERWTSCLAEKFLVVSRVSAADGGHGEIRWIIDLAARTMQECGEDMTDGQWNIVGSPEAWRAVLLGEVNLYAAMRRCDLRYCDPGDSGPFAMQLRTAMLADLLGLNSEKLNSEKTAVPEKESSLT
jgi:hypothetical protein